MIEPLPDYRFPLGEFPICSLGVRLGMIAERFALTIATWDEDGLGTAHGVAFRVPSGRVFVLRELAHAVEYLRASGPDVYVDVQEVEVHGVEPLVLELREALGLGTEALSWIQPGDGRDAARNEAEHARRWLASKAKRRRGGTENG